MSVLQIFEIGSMYAESIVSGRNIIARRFTTLSLPPETTWRAEYCKCDAKSYKVEKMCLYVQSRLHTFWKERLKAFRWQGNIHQSSYEINLRLL